MSASSQNERLSATGNLLIPDKDYAQARSQNVGMAKERGPENHLRAWREHRRMPQEQLAEKIGTTGNVISQIESGARGLSHKWLVKLAPHLGTTPGFLLDHRPDDLDTVYLDAAMSVPVEKRTQAIAILQTFRTGTGG